MFPLMHYYIGKTITNLDSAVVALSSVLPDLCVNMGLERSYGHSAGEDFYRWAAEQAPEGREVAFLFALHGVSPQGLDYYSDEAWHGGERGFCFQYAEQYLSEVVSACAVPEKWAAWKGHNLVEMAFEADIAERYPDLCRTMLAAATNQDAIGFVAQIFAAFAGISPQTAAASLEKIPLIFAIEQGTPQQLAEKYEVQLRYRHHITNASIPKIACLIQRIREEQQPAMADFLTKALPLIEANLHQMAAKYPISATSPCTL